MASERERFDDPVIASSNRFADLRPYINYLFAKEPLRWGQIFPYDFPQKGTKEQEEKFIRKCFGDREIHMQGGADHPGNGFRFLKQVWYSIALYNFEIRVPLVVNKWLQENRELVDDPNMHDHFFSEDVQPSPTIFDENEMKLYGEKFMKVALKALQYQLRQSTQQTTTTGDQHAVVDQSSVAMPDIEPPSATNPSLVTEPQQPTTSSNEPLQEVPRLEAADSNAVHGSEDQSTISGSTDEPSLSERSKLLLTQSKSAPGLESSEVRKAARDSKPSTANRRSSLNPNRMSGSMNRLQSLNVTRGDLRPAGLHGQATRIPGSQPQVPFVVQTTSGGAVPGSSEFLPPIPYGHEIPPSNASHYSYIPPGTFIPHQSNYHFQPNSFDTMAPEPYWNMQAPQPHFPASQPPFHTEHQVAVHNQYPHNSQGRHIRSGSNSRGGRNRGNNGSFRARGNRNRSSFGQSADQTPDFIRMFERPLPGDGFHPPYNTDHQRDRHLSNTHFDTRRGNRYQQEVRDPGPQAYGLNSHSQNPVMYGSRSSGPEMQASIEMRGRQTIPENTSHVRKLIVFSVPSRLSDDEVGQFFSQFGMVEKWRRNAPKPDVKDKSNVFVTFADSNAAYKCLEHNGAHWAGGSFKVQIAKEQLDRKHSYYQLPKQTSLSTNLPEVENTHGAKFDAAPLGKRRYEFAPVDDSAAPPRDTHSRIDTVEATGSTPAASVRQKKKGKKSKGTISRNEMLHDDPNYFEQEHEKIRSHSHKSTASSAAAAHANDNINDKLDGKLDPHGTHVDDASNDLRSHASTQLSQEKSVDSGALHATEAVDEPRKSTQEKSFTSGITKSEKKSQEDTAPAAEELQNQDNPAVMSSLSGIPTKDSGSEIGLNKAVGVDEASAAVVVPPSLGAAPGEKTEAVLKVVDTPASEEDSFVSAREPIGPPEEADETENLSQKGSEAHERMEDLAQKDNRTGKLPATLAEASADLSITAELEQQAASSTESTSLAEPKKDDSTEKSVDLPVVPKTKPKGPAKTESFSLFAKSVKQKKPKPVKGKKSIKNSPATRTGSDEGVVANDDGTPAKSVQSFQKQSKLPPHDTSTRQDDAEREDQSKKPDLKHDESVFPPLPAFIPSTSAEIRKDSADLQTSSGGLSKILTGLFGGQPSQKEATVPPQQPVLNYGDSQPSILSTEKTDRKVSDTPTLFLSATTTPTKDEARHAVDRATVGVLDTNATSSKIGTADATASDRIQAKPVPSEPITTNDEESAGSGAPHDDTQQSVAGLGISNVSFETPGIESEPKKKKKKKNKKNKSGARSVEALPFKPMVEVKSLEATIEEFARADEASSTCESETRPSREREDVKEWLRGQPHLIVPPASRYIRRRPTSARHSEEHGNPYPSGDTTEEEIQTDDEATDETDSGKSRGNSDSEAREVKKDEVFESEEVMKSRAKLAKLEEEEKSRKARKNEEHRPVAEHGLKEDTESDATL